MFWCSNCPGSPCINGSSFLAARREERINGTTRVPSSLLTMRTSTRTVNEFRPTFQGPSDRFISSYNPITKSTGVDKKHNSYDRYLARKKGKVICCCTCDQLIKNSETGVFIYAPKVGDKAIQSGTGAIGTVISFTTGGGMANDIDTVTIRADGCSNLFQDGQSIVFWGPGGTAATMTVFTILSTNNCGGSA